MRLTEVKLIIIYLTINQEKTWKTSTKIYRLILYMEYGISAHHSTYNL